jgi:uncharacterized protein YecE (DUF72 family)
VDSPRLGLPPMIRIGTSGWSYPNWEPALYPPGLPPGQRLAHYTAAFDTVELNSSFYRWPRSAAFAAWRRRLPAMKQVIGKSLGL